MIKITNLNKYYKSGNEKFHALKDINITFGNSGIHFVHGKSGSGKSTLLNIIGGLDSYDSGELIIDNVNTSHFTKRNYNTYRNTYIGFVFQEFNVLKGLSVYENVALSIELQHLSVKENHYKIQDIIDKVGLTGLENRMMNEISGGQRQRVAIARALIKNPRVIIADEPTGNLDSKNSKMVMDLLKELSVDHLIIVVTHNDKLAKEYADRIIELKDGEIIGETGTNNIDDDQLDLTPVKVPLKTSLNLALKSIAKNKLRFIVMILLFTLSLTFAGVVVNLSVADTAKTYTEYQQEYGNFVINTSKNYLSRGNALTTAFFDYEVMNMTTKYNNDEASTIRLLKGMDYFLPITDSEDPNGFWMNNIQRVHLYDTQVMAQFPIIAGRLSASASAIAITDYIADNLLQLNYFGEEVTTRNQLLNQRLSFDGYNDDLIITGIIQTNYSDFLTRDMSDTKVSAAFKDNLVFYNSIFMRDDNYNTFYSYVNIDYSYDDIIYDVMNKTGMIENVLFTTYSKAPDVPHAELGKEPTKPEDGQPTQLAVSSGLLKAISGIDGTVDELFNKVYYEITYEKTVGNFVTGNIYSNNYFNAIRRIPASFGCWITDVIDTDEVAIYLPDLDETDLYSKFLSATYGGGGFVTLLTDTKDLPTADIVTKNSQYYQDMADNNININNLAYQKVMLVDNFIDENLWLFIGIFFVFGLFSVLLIFNFIIINIKNSTRDIGIYMSLGLSGFRISLIYFFQVILMGLITFVLAIIAVMAFLIVLDIRFTALSAVNLTIIKMTAVGVGAVLAIATLVPTLAVIIPLFNLSRKQPVDVIKSV